MLIKCVQKREQWCCSNDANMWKFVITINHFLHSDQNLLTMMRWWDDNDDNDYDDDNEMMRWLDDNDDDDNYYED